MHDQLTFHGVSGTPALALLPQREPDKTVLRFGFTCGQTEALAWRAVRYHVPSRGMNSEDRFEAAWGAVAECLYAAAEPPGALDLFKAGLGGLDRLRRAGLHERGFRQKRDGSDPGAWMVPAGSFYRYWTRPAEPTPEDVATDRAAVRQVMAAIPAAYAQALLALAEHGDYERAAGALGLSRTAYNSRVQRARAAFLALWHEHEAVPRQWRTDKRLYRRSPRGQHADAVTALSDIRDTFAGRATIASTDLLVRLAAADTGRYGTWDCHDLGALLGTHGVTRHRVPVDGDDRKRVGYRLADIDGALADLTAPGALERQAA